VVAVSLHRKLRQHLAAPVPLAYKRRSASAHALSATNEKRAKLRD